MRTYSGTATNLLGTLGVTVLDSTGAVIVARSTAAVTQPVTGSYEYQTPDHARNATEVIGYRWDEGSAATTVTDWVAPTGSEIGSDLCTVTVRSGGSPLAGARVHVSNPTTPSREKVTDSHGAARFRLVDGATYSLWVFHDDYSGANPTTFTATKD